MPYRDRFKDLIVEKRSIEEAFDEKEELFFLRIGQGLCGECGDPEDDGERVCRRCVLIQRTDRAQYVWDDITSPARAPQP